jgi:hypothetical protein
MQPLVLAEGEYSASLDGLTFDGELLLEIKCPVRGKESTLWRQVGQGEIPAHYRWQLEHQFLVSKARRGHLYVFDGADGLLLEVTPQPERWTAIHEAWDGFMRCIETDTPPPLSERDKVIRQDAEWQAAALRFVELKAEAERLAGRLETAKEALVGLASHPSESGFGVTVTRFFKQGAVDYKRVPELTGVELAAYRQKGRWETRISTTN